MLRDAAGARGAAADDVRAMQVLAAGEEEGHGAKGKIHRVDPTFAS
jgi:hypothetical protein